MEVISPKMEHERALRERHHRAVDAHLGYHRAYGSEPQRLLDDAPGFGLLAGWARGCGVDFATVLGDVLALLPPETGAAALDSQGTPPAMAGPPDSAPVSAAALGAWLGSSPPILAPLARRACVRALAESYEPDAGGIACHPDGPALLDAVESANPDDDARERARRSLEHGLKAAWVEGKLGPVAAACFSAHLRELLASEEPRTLEALRLDLEQRPRPIKGLYPLQRLLRRVAPWRAPRAEQAERRPEDLLFLRIERGAARLEESIEAATGERVKVWLGPMDAVAPEGFVEAFELRPGVKEKRRGGLHVLPFLLPLGVSREITPTEPPPSPSQPSPPATRHLQRWCRRVAPLLTPSLRERLLLPV
jgi:hypothetical protein